MKRIKNFFSGALREKAKKIYYYEFHLGWVMVMFVILYTILMVGLMILNTSPEPEPIEYIDPVDIEGVERIALTPHTFTLVRRISV